MSVERDDLRGEAFHEEILHDLCAVPELENNQMKEFEIVIPGVKTTILLIKQNNQFYAYSSKCCHYKLPLIKGVLTNNRIRCFAHGACFRVDTGDIEDHPGHGNLIKYKVEIIDDRVFLVASKEDLERVERSKIPDDMQTEGKPVVAIIGAGAAGFTCADMLRQNGFRGRIILVSREGTLPYDRVQLSKQPNKNAKDLLLREPAYFKRAKIDMMLETEVINVNWSAKNFTYRTLGNQLKSLHYDYLVLAMGLRSRQLPSSFPGSQLRSIFYVRSLEDASRLVSHVTAPETKNVVIIGDSFIALELCGWLTTGLPEKKNVSVVMKGKSPMSRIFGQRIGQALQKMHERNGAKFYAEAQTIGITGGNDRVTHVQLASGESVPCELVIVAIGSEPCTEFCQQSSLEMTKEGYVRVNQRLETSIDDVLAIGDIAQYPLKVFNLEEVNCQHWQMACSTGHQAANTILHHYLGHTGGSSRSFKSDLYTTPIFWTTQNKSTTIRFAGYVRNPDQVIIHGDLGEELKFVAYYIVDGYVRAVAQSKYEPVSSEVAEVFYHRRNIRQEDIENDPYGYRKYLQFGVKTST